MRARILCLGLLAAGTLGLVPAPGTAQINIGITIGTPSPPPIVISAPPQLVVVPQTQVLYAPALPYNYFFYSGKYMSPMREPGLRRQPTMAPGPLSRLSACPSPFSVCRLPTTRSRPGTAKRKARPGSRATVKDRNTRSTKATMISKRRERWYTTRCGSHR